MISWGFFKGKFIKQKLYPPTLTKVVMVHIFCSRKQLFVLSPLFELLPYWEGCRSLPFVFVPISSPVQQPQEPHRDENSCKCKPACTDQIAG